MTMVKDPQDCGTMAEVRAGVDDVDRAIVGLIARRFGFMDAAARIKTDRSTVRDEERKAEVLRKVRASADAAGIDPDLVARMYEQLIEGSIAYELRKWDERPTGEA
jgi:isochorismate pyruvate lyase